MHATLAGGRRFTEPTRYAKPVCRAGALVLAAMVAAFVLAGVHQTSAFDPASALTRCGYDSRQVEDRLPRGTVDAIAQTRDGNLWLGALALDAAMSRNDGPWNGRVAALTFSVAPRFFETGWFCGLCVLVALLTAFAAHRLRIRKIAARSADFAAQAADRTAKLEEANALLSERTRELEEANRRLELLSTVDGLTEAANRRQFDHVLDAEWRRCARTGLPLALLMIDIDHFKPFNDGYGHVTGDVCLKKVAGVVRRLVQRAGELVARYGGEEFAVLLPGSDAPHARELAESIRLEVELLAIAHAYSKVAPVITISAGVAAMIPIYGNTPGELISAADRALYYAKQTGRNRVSLTPPG